jgi:hypothetical protein
VSESASVATSIMDRGRPRKRSDGLKRSASKTSKSAERRAFETLPKGWKVTDAAQMLEQAERAALHKQAMQQAARFEVMRKEDVDSLSRVGSTFVRRWVMRLANNAFTGAEELG